MNYAISNSIITDWPGWPLSENRFGHEFDLNARIRMILGSKVLIKFLIEHLHEDDEAILEVGPFFNPLLLDDEIGKKYMSTKKIYFLENDSHAGSWINRDNQYHLIDLDMNSDSFERDLNDILFNKNPAIPLFDSIIISQVINYIDYKKIFYCFYSLLREGGKIFINNVINFGIPELFSDFRPRSNAEIISTVEEIGFSVKEFHLLPRQFEKEPEERLILILSKITSKVNVIKK